MTLKIVFLFYVMLTFSPCSFQMDPLMPMEENSNVYLDYYIKLALQSKQVIDTLVKELQTLQAKVETKQVKIEISEKLQKTSVFLTNSNQPTQVIQNEGHEATGKNINYPEIKASSVALNHSQSQIQHSNEFGINLNYGVHTSESSEEIVVENNQFWKNADEVKFDANEDMSHQTETAIQYVHDFESVGTE